MAGRLDMMEPHGHTHPFASLEEPIPALLASLQDFVPMRLWMVSRITGGRWTVIGAEDRSGQIKTGASFSSADPFYRYLAMSRHPCFREDASAAHDPAMPHEWAGMAIRAYIGYPLISHRKEVLATLCGIDEQRQPPFTLRQRRLVATSARTIGLLLTHSRSLHESRRFKRQLKPPAEIDQLTGLPNLLAWQNMIEKEQAVLMQHGENALVAIVEVQEPVQGDMISLPEWDKNALRDAALLKSQLRDSDTIARVGVNRYALLMRRVTEEQEQHLFEKIRRGFSEAGVAIAIGYAMLLPSGSLAEAVRMADIRMYNAKLRASA